MALTWSSTKPLRNANAKSPLTLLKKEKLRQSEELNIPLALKAKEIPK